MLARRSLSLLATAAIGMLAAGCTNDDDRVATPAATEAVSSEASPTPGASAEPEATPGGAGPMQGGSTEPAHADPDGTGTALLTAVRAATQDGYDRVVFEFSGSTVPGYDVGYADGPVTQDGSGQEVDLDGDAALLVRMQPAADADLSDADAPRTYTGPDRFTPGTDEVTELARVSGFEGVLSWGIGVHGRSDFHVSTFSSPPRIVVDVRRP